jgi:hypothetical protein
LSSSRGFQANLILSHIVAALFALFILLGARHIIMMCSMARPRRLMASMLLYDIIVIHCGIMRTSLIAASCQLCCCISSSCDFHIVLYLYSDIRCLSHTPVGLYCYESSMRTYKVFLAASLLTLIAASFRLYLRHYCRLYLSSHRTTWGITADSIRRLIGRLAASSPSWFVIL